MMPAQAAHKLTLGDLLGELLPHDRQELAGLVVDDIASDSRLIESGAVFFALGGLTSHGLDHLHEALQRGAAAVVYQSDSPRTVAPLTAVPTVPIADLSNHMGAIASRYFRTHARGAPVVVGITGTNGKTSVAWLVAEALRKLGGQCGYIGTLGWGILPQLNAQSLTTPDCITLHRRLATITAAKDPVVMEVSSHALDQARVAGVPFEVAVFTNLSRDHLDYHTNMAAYADSKARLFAVDELQHAVINIDDEFGVELASRATGRGVDVITTSSSGQGHGRLSAQRLPGARVCLSIDGDGHPPVTLASQLFGEFNAENLILSLGVLETLGIERGDAVAALAQCPPPPGRMEVFGGDGTPTVVVDFAHTPTALERALKSVKSLVEGELIVVFGCGGDRDKGKRAPMGEVAARWADRVILTDDNPRGESSAAITDAICAGIDPQQWLMVEHDRGAAIAWAIAHAGADDVVLVAGKGHEVAQVRADVALQFSDQEQVMTALEAWR
jgi:UDP-N-acetylmuramoyl-L-alanyl-D-glutamate--2,6-diaminopimelate ligase